MKSFLETGEAIDIFAVKSLAWIRKLLETPLPQIKKHPAFRRDAFIRTAG
jgi:hypothetical protein